MTEGLNWGTWRDVLLESNHLTVEGRRVANEIVDTFSEFFGDKPIGDPNHIFWVLAAGGLSPYNNAPQVFYRLLDLYAHIRLVTDKGIKGYHDLRKKIAHSPTGTSFRHLVMQLELAGFAARNGHDVEFEPVLEGSKTGDVRVLRLDEKEDLELEACSLQASNDVSISIQSHQQFTHFLHSLCFQLELQVEGTLRKPIPQDIIDGLLNDIQKKARRVASYGGKRSVNTPWYHLLFFKEDKHASFFPKLTKKVPPIDSWRRLERAIWNKVNKTPNTGLWIRLDDVSGMFYFPDWSRATYYDRLKILTQGLRNLFEQYPNLLGFIFTNHGGMLFEADHLSRYGRNVAMRKALPTQWTRETFILGRDDSVSDSLDEITTWFDNEPTWLPWALQELDLPNFNQLVIGT